MCQHRLSEEARQAFVSAMVTPRVAAGAAKSPTRSESRGPGLKKCAKAQNGMSAQLEWFARSLQRGS